MSDMEFFARLIALLLYFSIPYIVYRLIKRLITYGIDYYFTRLKNYEEVFKGIKKD